MKRLFGTETNKADASRATRVMPEDSYVQWVHIVSFSIRPLHCDGRSPVSSCVNDNVFRHFEKLFYRHSLNIDL